MSATPQLRAPADSGALGDIQLQCTMCGQSLRVISAAEASDLRCERCGFIIACTRGIFRTLPPDRGSYYKRFIREYAEIRNREGRGSPNAAYYLSLPFADLSGRNTWQWSIRAKTFRYFTSRILSRIEHESAAPLRILDIGAGNGWLSYRLALRGHRPVALDLLENDEDGLGAARHYFSSCEPFIRVQAEMDRLPFTTAQFDVVLFNASFHYSEVFTVTMREAVRCTRAGGHVVVLDSPFYRDSRSGQQMVKERQKQFLETYGFASNSIASRQFLSREDLALLRARFAAEWKVLKPWYGWKWALRPWNARLGRRREPAKFHIIWARLPR